MVSNFHAQNGRGRLELLSLAWLVSPSDPGLPPGEGDWIPARVPGDVRLSLLDAGWIPDPLFGRNHESLGWINEKDWWYRCPLPALTGGRNFLIFDGLDYDAEIFAGGGMLGRHEGMFSRQRYELPAGTRGDLSIRFRAPASLRKPRLSPRDRLWTEFLKRTIGGDFFPDRLGTLKCQMGFGWDFAPAIPTIGIWDSAEIQNTGPVAITGIAVDARTAGSGARINVRLGLSSLAPADVELHARVEPVGHDSPETETRDRVRLGKGDQRTTLRLVLDEARLWQPWEWGGPARYRVMVDAFVEGRLTDSAAAEFGVRSVEMFKPDEGRAEAPGRGHVGLKINGRELFIRGANWVPVDSLLADLTPERYRGLLEKARDAGINLLRVWGGGLRERQAFYDICDELGILVWQELPFSVAFFDHFPIDSDFVSLVEQEVAGIVRAIRNHPSVAVWCGGNEFNPDHNRQVVDAMARSISVEDGTRPFRAASPSSGERHDWSIWHSYANVADYRKNDAPLLSEFGLQAAPDPASLRQFLPPEGLSPGADWEAHSAQLDKLRRYAAAYLPAGAAPSVEAFVEATQRAQANGLQIAIEHVRRRRGRTTGTMFWQFNEPWGAICWSVLDYFGRPKLAYERLKAIYQPLLVSLDYPLRRYRDGDRISGTLWAVNDGESHGVLTLNVLSGGEVIDSRRVAVPGLFAMNAGDLDVRLPRAADFRLELRDGDGRILAGNRYDLEWEDLRRISFSDYVRDRIAWGVLHE